MAIVCIDIKGYTRADGTEVEAHKRCVDMNNVDGETRVKISDFIQQIGRGTNDFDPVDTDREFRDLDRIIKNAIAKNEDKPIEVTDFDEWKNSVISEGLFGVELEPIDIPEDIDKALAKATAERKAFYEQESEEENEDYWQIEALLRDKELRLKDLKNGQGIRSRDKIDPVIDKLDQLNDPYKTKKIGLTTMSNVQKGEKINEHEGLGSIYKADVDGYLFRGVSIEDYKRIKESGFITTDGRGNINADEGINMSSSPRTAFGYLPEEGGVVMAIDVSNKDSLFMIDYDSYVRSSEPIPFSDVKAVTTPTVGRLSSYVVDGNIVKPAIADKDDPALDKILNGNTGGWSAPDGREVVNVMGKELYHVTTKKNEIEADGKLRAASSLDSTGLGGSESFGVSFYTNRADAEKTLEEMNFLYLANNGKIDELKEALPEDRLKDVESDVQLSLSAQPNLDQSQLYRSALQLTRLKHGDVVIYSPERITEKPEIISITANSDRFIKGVDEGEVRHIGDINLDGTFSDQSNLNVAEMELTGSEDMLADLLEGNFKGNEDKVINMIASEEGLRPSQVKRMLAQAGYGEDPSKNPEFIKELGNLKQGYVANHKVEETPSFKAWSRGYDVVDGEVSSQFLKTGEPMVVTAYHGTKNNFEVFDAEGRSNSGGAFGSVNYFTTKYEDADHNYAENNDGASPLDRQQSRVEYDINKRLESLDFRDTATDIIEGLVDDYNLEDSDIDMDMLTEAIENHAPYDASLMIVAATGAGGGKVLPLYLRLDNPLIIDYQNTKWWNESIPTLYPLDEDTIEELSNEYKETYGLEAGDDVPLMEVHHLNGTLEDDLNLWGAIDTALDKTIGDGASYNYAQKIRDKLAETSYWYEGEANPATLHDDLQKAAYEAGVDGHSVSTFASEVFYTMGYDALVLKNADKMWNGLLMPADTNHIHIPDRHKDHIKLANGLNIDFTESVNIRDGAGHKSFVDKIKGTKFEGMPLSKIMGTQEGKDFYNDYIREIKLNHLPRKRG